MVPGPDAAPPTPLYFVPTTVAGTMADRAVSTRRAVEPDDADRRDRRGDEPRDVLLGRARDAPSWPPASRSSSSRDRQRGADGGPDRQAARRRRGDRRGPQRGDPRDAAGLGADRVVSLESDESVEALAEAAAEVDVVIDYLWGKPAEAAIPAIVRARTDRARALRWVQIGAITGPDIALPSAALRACNLKLMGSGQGSVSTAGIVEELPALAREVSAGNLAVDADPIPLADVETAWNAPVAPGRRLVFVP